MGSKYRKRNQPGSNYIPKKSMFGQQKALTGKIRKVLTGVTERKYLPYTSLAVELNNAPTLFDTPFIPTQGSSDTTRVGDKCTFLNYDATFWIKQGTASAGPSSCRIIIFKFTESSVGNAPANSQIMQDASANFISLSTAPHHDFNKNYKIVYDKRFVLDWTATGAVMPIGSTKIIRIKLKLNNTVQWSAGGTNGTNKLYFMICSNQATGTACPKADIMSKLTFIDV